MAAGAESQGDRGRGKRLVLLGPPNCGKGTQAQVISERLGVPAISTGEMLRQARDAGSELGEKVKGIMASGELVDDETMAHVVRDRLQHPDAAGGYLLDGYPRTLPQAETLAGILRESGDALDAAVLIEVPEDELVRRAMGRGREDDREEVARERFRVYREKTEPLIGYYRNLSLLQVVDGNRPIDEVSRGILESLGESP